MDNSEIKKWPSKWTDLLDSFPRKYTGLVDGGYHVRVVGIVCVFVCLFVYLFVYLFYLFIFLLKESLNTNNIIYDITRKC